jgi:hypothetical protein
MKIRYLAALLALAVADPLHARQERALPGPLARPVQRRVPEYHAEHLSSQSAYGIAVDRQQRCSS